MVGRTVGSKPNNCIKMVSNTTQPDLATLKRISELLEVNVSEIINFS